MSQTPDLQSRLASSSSLMRWRASGAAVMSDGVSDCYSDTRMWFVSGGFHFGATPVAD